MFFADYKFQTVVLAQGLWHHTSGWHDQCYYFHLPHTPLQFNVTSSFEIPLDFAVYRFSTPVLRAAVYTTKLPVVFNKRNVGTSSATNFRIQLRLYLSFYSTPFLVGRDSAVGTATCYGLEVPEIESRWEPNIPHPSRADLRPSQPPIQYASGYFLG